jgi:hypothetical protein
MKIVFKNLEKSEIAKDAVRERISELLEKFPHLKKSSVLVTLEMHNSPLHAGPDSFSISFRASGGKYDGVSLTKYSHSLYVALADLIEHALEILNRCSDKKRVVERNIHRKFLFKNKQPV